MITEVSPGPDAGGFSTIEGSHLTRRSEQISGRSVVPRQLVIQVLVLRLKQTGRSVVYKSAATLFATYQQQSPKRKT